MSRNKKGQFQKGNSAATKKRAIYMRHDTKVPETPREDLTKHLNDDFIPFGVNNDFPQATASLARKSPVHRALLRSKTSYITGSNFVTDNEKLKGFLDQANEKESFRDVNRKAIYDKLSGGNGFIQLIHDSSGNLLKAFHIDYTKCRLSADGLNIIIHPNWLKYRNSRKLAAVIPLYPNFTKSEEGNLRVSMVHLKDYEPEFHHYGIPSSIAGNDAAGIAYKTNKWNVSRLDNDFKTSGILIVDSDFSDEDAESFETDFRNQFTGEGKQGQVMMIRKNIGDNTEGTKFVPVTNGTEGDWIQLHKQSTDELIIAHNWFRSLSGLALEGQLGNTQQIKNEYKIAINTVVEDEQKNLLSVYNRIFSDFGMDDPDLAIFNKPIIELHEVDSNAIGGIQEIIDKVKNEQLNEEQASLLLELSYGINKEQSTILING